MAHITFVIPGDYRSGGVRVTVMMANLLRSRGHSVRVAFPKARNTGVASRIRRWISMLRPTANPNAGWLSQFTGRAVPYGRLDDLDYSDGEVVVAVGTYMVAEVRSMQKQVVKVRYNHGFPSRPDAIQLAAWRGRMPTITVSSTLVPRLQEETEGSVWGVVPNGIDPDEYFVEPGVSRNSIGALYNSHPNKAPEDLIAVLHASHQRWPMVPQVVFGTGKKPTSLSHTDYTRLPSVPDARLIYNRCKVWVLTSRSEGLPGVVLEAMACGCVVVTSDNEGSLEIIQDGVNGLVAPRGDRGKFLDQIARLLEDEGLRSRLSKAGQERIKEFSWERAADRMEAFLQEAPNLKS